MKNFDLNACGVQEMNAAEVAEVNGGFLLAACCVVLAVTFIAGQCVALSGGADPEGSHGQKLH